MNTPPPAPTSAPTQPKPFEFKPITPEQANQKAHKLLRNIYTGTTAVAAAGLLVGGFPITAGAVAGGYAGYQIGRRVLPTIGSTILDIGDPEGKSGASKLVQWLIKRGEADMPPAWKTILTGADFLVKGLTFPAQIVAAAISVTELALQLMGKAALEKFYNKPKAEQAKIMQEMFEKNAKQLEVERQHQEFMKNGTAGIDLLNNQQQLIESGFDTGADPIKDRELKVNLFSLLGIDPRKDDDLSVESLEAKAKQREEYNKIYKLVPKGIAPDEATRKLNEIYVYLSKGEEAGLSTAEVDTIKKALGDANFDRNSLEARVFLEELEEVIEKLGYPNASLDPIVQEMEDAIGLAKRINNQVVAAIPANATNPAGTPANLDKRNEIMEHYRENWLAGAAYGMVGTHYRMSSNEHLPEEAKKVFIDLGFGPQNPLALLNFATIPEQSAVTSEKTRLQSIGTNVVPLINESNIEKKIRTLRQLKLEAVIDRDLFILSSLNPVEAVLLNKASYLSLALDTYTGGGPLTLPPQVIVPPITDTTVIKLLKELFSRSFNNPPELFFSDIDEVRDQIIQTGGAYPELLGLLNELYDFSDRNLGLADALFGDGTPDSNNASVLNVIKSMNDSAAGPKEIDFFILFEGLGGDFNLLKTDRKEQIPLNIISVFDRKIRAVGDLETLLGNPGKTQKLQKAHLDYLKSIYSGDAVVESNLRKGNGRDHALHLTEMRELLDAIENDRTNPPLDFNYKALKSFIQQKGKDIKGSELIAPNNRDTDALKPENFKQDAGSLITNLTNLYEVLTERSNLLDIDSANLTEDEQQEYFLLKKLLSILELLGAKQKGDKFEFNEKLLMMYLNGYNLSFTGSTGADLSKTIRPAGSPVGLQLGKKVTMP
ncbi:MAG: hypothetical protein ACMG57_00890, partial [Candidatus Dojkabacteria bacterium]